ncbi:MAG TPA: hypothetical protein VFG08_10640, partial [Candidatus Polarisedimenticolia bacterium]|nr:hypothetical protein [Candidatus Polarisedimenticolia bacterium]
MRRRSTGVRIALPLLLFFLFLLLPAAHASAEERKNSWEINLFGGYSWTGTDINLSGEPSYGLRVGWNFLPAFEIELQAMTTSNAVLESQESILIANPGAFLTNPGRTFTADSLCLRFLINPGNQRRRLKPYMLFGVGRIDYAAKPELQPAEVGEETSTLFSIGGGIRQ